MVRALQITKRKMALTIGYSLILMALVAGFAYGYVFNSVYVQNQPATTLHNIKAVGILFPAAVVSFIIILLLDILVAWALYHYFKQNKQTLSLLSAWFRILYTSVLAVSIIYLFSAMQESYKDSIVAEHVQNNMDNFLSIWCFGLIIFSIHLAALGKLILKSTDIPNIIGYITIVAAACYFGTNVANLLWEDYEHYKKTLEMALSIPMALGELVLAGWLIFKHMKTPETT